MTSCSADAKKQDFVKSVVLLRRQHDFSSPGVKKTTKIYPKNDRAPEGSKITFFWASGCFFVALWPPGGAQGRPGGSPKRHFFHFFRFGFFCEIRCFIRAPARSGSSGAPSGDFRDFSGKVFLHQILAGGRFRGMFFSCFFAMKKRLNK